MTELRTLLKERGVVLLDFDGPVCSVFAGVPNRVAASRLVAMLSDDDTPTDVAASSDPFAVLNYAATVSAPDLRRIEDGLTDIETEAVSSAAPTPGSAIAIKAMAQSHRIAIVSNNSTRAIETYLERHDIAEIEAVCGRYSPDVSLLKPNPHLLEVAMAALHVHASDCVFIGDSVTDLQAAAALGVPAIAFANSPSKRETFVQHRPAVIITAMDEISAAASG